MSGDHNMYCSGNQPDLIERLRDINISWSDEGEIAATAADEIERLREELKTERVLSFRNEVRRLEEQLAEITAERNRVWWREHWTEYEMTPSCFADFRYGDISAERGCEDCPCVVSCAGNTKIVNKALTKFVEQVSRLSIWDYDDYQECEYPAEGYLDSHCCLMELVEAARKLIPYRSKE